jgi:hypothetical protein
MAFALLHNESDQRLNVPIRTNTQRFCLVRTVHYQAKGCSSPRNPTRAFTDICSHDDFMANPIYSYELL